MEIPSVVSKEAVSFSAYGANQSEELERFVEPLGEVGESIFCSMVRTNAQSFIIEMESEVTRKLGVKSLKMYVRGSSLT